MLAIARLYLLCTGRLLIIQLCLLFLFSNGCRNLLVQGDKVGSSNPKPNRILQYEDNKIYIYDNIFKRKSLSIISDFVTRYAPWDFIYPEKYEGMQSNDNGNLHWVANLSPQDFAKSKIWKILTKKLPEALEINKYYPYHAQSILINRGDFPTVQKAKNNGDLLIKIFLTQGLKKNDYSELVFYDKRDEIFGCVYPKYGRIALWNDTVDFVFKPPSMHHISGEYSLFIKATQEKSRFEESIKTYKDQAMKRAHMAKKPFPFSYITDESVYQINLTQHLTRKFFDSKNRVVAVFDNVIPRHILFALRKYFFDYDSSYVYNAYDPTYTEEHDNVNWVAQVPAELLPKSQVWHYVHHIAAYISNESKWHPYDVSMNIIQHNHHPRIHADCSKWEHEYTFLMYLTPDWSEQRYGETIFFEETDTDVKKSKKIKPGNEEYETLGAVTPKFGRIVIFRNIIDHSARPPSPDFLAARYTFAVKVGRSPEIAIAKKLREMLGDFVEEGKDGFQLMQDLSTGKYDTMGDGNNEGFLKEKYSHFKEVKDKFFKSERTRVYKMLSMPPTK